MLGPFTTASRLTPIHQVSPLYCRTPPAHRCPRRQRRQRQWRRQWQRVTEGTAMAPCNGPNNMHSSTAHRLNSEARAVVRWQNGHVNTQIGFKEVQTVHRTKVTNTLVSESRTRLMTAVPVLPHSDWWRTRWNVAVARLSTNSSRRKASSIMTFSAAESMTPPSLSTSPSPSSADFFDDFIFF